MSRVYRKVLNSFSKVSNHIKSLAPRVLSNFSENELRDIRLVILQDILHKGFPYYSTLLQNAVDNISNVIVDDIKVSNDHIFDSTLPWGENVFWSEEIPELAQKYYKRRLLIGFQKRQSGIGRTLSLVINDRVVNTLVGDVAWMNVSQKILFSTVLSSYFQIHEELWPILANMDYGYRQQVGLLGVPNARAAVLTAALSGAGPFVLKILQQVQSNAEESSAEGQLPTQKIGDSDLEQAAKNVLKNVIPLNDKEFALVLQTLQHNDQLAPYVQEIKADAKPLGSASLAIAYFATKNGNPTAVVKFLKPMYIYYYLCEIDFMLKHAWKIMKTKVRFFVANEREHKYALIKARKLLLFFLKSYATEFNYEAEAKFTELGFKTYNFKSLRIKTPRLLAVSTNPFPALVTELAKGLTLQDWVEYAKHVSPKERFEIMAQLYVRVSLLYQKWLSIVLVGSGYFHADLHLGNIMWDRDTDTLYIIDFGSGGILDRRQQNGLVQAIIISLLFKQPSLKDQDFLKQVSKRRLSQTDRKRLERIKTEIGTYHTANIEVSRRFVQQIYRLCQIPPNKEEIEHLSRVILKYPNGLYFADLFLNFATDAQNIGSCIAGNVLLFGRGTAYLLTAINTIIDLCANNDKCPEFLLTSALPSLLKTSFLRVLGLGAKAFVPTVIARNARLRKGHKNPIVLTEKEILEGQKEFHIKSRSQVAEMLQSRKVNNIIATR